MLVKWADVLVTNFLPRVRQRLRLNYEDVASLNPRLIYTDITRYGELGPKADKPGFDHTAYWARSGLMQFTRDASSPPALPVSGIGDHATRFHFFAGIVSGLCRREHTGKGCNVQTSLTANGTWATATWVQVALQGAKFTGPIDRRHPPNALWELPNPRQSLGNPCVRRGRQELARLRVVPERGEYTERVLEEPGFDAAQIDDLRANGAILPTRVSRAITRTRRLNVATAGAGR